MADHDWILEEEFDDVDESFFEAEDIAEEEKDAKEKTEEGQKFAQDFSFRQIGSIAQYIEPVSVSLPIEYVLKVFAENPDIQAVPVEEYDVVVGYIDRKSIEYASKNILRKFMLKDTKKYVRRVPLVIYAIEYCEQCLSKVFAVEEEFGTTFFPVFHHRKSFYGLVSIEDLVERISEIRRQDLERAKVIQQEIMPDALSLKALPFSVCAWNQMANPIGGDLYSIYRITSTKYIAACFDVSGKNVAAALVTIALGSFFSALKRFPQVVFTPEKIISELDRFIEDIVPLGTFVTAGIFYVDMDTKRLSIFNCGHTTIYFFLPRNTSDGKRTVHVSEVEAFLPPLGMGATAETLEGGNVKIPCCAIERGLKAELYSDGLTDMQTKEGIRYGDERVKSLFKSLYSANRNELSKKIEQAVEEWTENWIEKTMLTDDITVVDILF